jgi:hypothetical protein
MSKTWFITGASAGLGCLRLKSGISGYPARAIILKCD